MAFTGKLSLSSKAKLSDGNLIPRLGLGVYEMSDQEASPAVTWALEAGYRHFDCAEWYYNEASVGSSITQFLSRPGCPIDRSDIFYCSKLQSNNGYESAKRSIEASLKKCGLGYIDLYLIHSPYGGKKRRWQCWKAIEEAKDKGLIKSVAVSNYGERHIRELLESKPKHRPTVNQCDLHPFMARKELVEYCESEGILLECWGPLVRAERFHHPAIMELAKKHSVTSAQVLMCFDNSLWSQSLVLTASLRPGRSPNRFPNNVSSRTPTFMASSWTIKTWTSYSALTNTWSPIGTQLATLLLDRRMCAIVQGIVQH
ncbi:hypothetical protein NDA11_007902 [Ustilago hordei]|nr:hypothetical protein NDA11_007902 [Ustilago hordei]